MTACMLCPSALSVCVCLSVGMSVTSQVFSLHMYLSVSVCHPCVCPHVLVCLSQLFYPIDVQVGFEQREYIVQEGSSGAQICVEHKECLEREFTVDITTNEITGLKDKLETTTT